MNVIIATMLQRPQSITFPSAISLQVMEVQPDYSVTLIPDHLVTEVSPVYQSV